MAYKFDYKKRLGSGYFGEVWLVSELGLGCDCALKKIPQDKLINRDNFFTEAQALNESEHPNIVKVRETGFLDDGSVYVLMEYLRKGSLEDESSGSYVPLKRASRIMIDILRGLEFMHEKKILHRDIKPANILIGDDSSGKLSDFGLSIKDINTLDLSSIKRFYYLAHLAPEINNFKDQSILSDIYACGVTMYRLVNGDSYLPSIPDAELEKKIKKGLYPIRENYREFVPRNIRTIINKAMNIDPKKRYKSANEMRRALESAYIKRNWSETMLSNGTKWSSGDNNKCIFIQRTVKDDKWQIQVSQGVSRATSRQIASLHKKGLNKKDAIVYTKDILQKYSTGKL